MFLLVLRHEGLTDPQTVPSPYRYYLDSAQKQMSVDNALLLSVMLPFSYSVMCHPDAACIWISSNELHLFVVNYGRITSILFVRHCILMLIGCSWMDDPFPAAVL